MIPLKTLYILATLAHLVGDFTLQSDVMVRTKSWKSGSMLAHIAIHWGVTYALLGIYGWVCGDISQGVWLSVATAIALGHYAIDCWKIAASRPYMATGIAVPSRFFVWDQIAHLIWIGAVVTLMYLLLGDNRLQAWAAWPEGLALKAIGMYVVWGPVSHVVRIVVSPFAPPNSPSQNGTPTVKNTGKLIGQIERVLILLLIFGGQIEAIGWLVTAKSILRFNSEEAKAHSEYLILGTLLSFGLAIGVGWAIEALI